MTSPPRSVVFDFGGVLVTWEPHVVWQRLLGDDEDVDAFLAEIGFEQWNQGLDAGGDWDEAVAEAVERFPHHREALLAYREAYVDTITGLIEGSVALLRELVAAHVPVYGLTNWSAEGMRRAQETLTFLPLLDGYVVSGDERIAKPDARLWRLLSERFGLTPIETVYIDDREDNIAVATELGFRTVHFTGPEALRQALRDLGLPVATHG